MTLEEINEHSSTETKAIDRLQIVIYLKFLLVFVVSIIAVLAPFFIQTMNSVAREDVTWAGSIWAGVISFFVILIARFGVKLQMQQLQMRQYELIGKLQEMTKTLNEKRQEQGLELLVVVYNEFRVPSLYPESDLKPAE